MRARACVCVHLCKNTSCVLVCVCVCVCVCVRACVSQCVYEWPGHFLRTKRIDIKDADLEILYFEQQICHHSSTTHVQVTSLTCNYHQTQVCHHSLTTHVRLQASGFRLQASGFRLQGWAYFTYVWTWRSRWRPWLVSIIRHRSVTIPPRPDTRPGDV